MIATDLEAGRVSELDELLRALHPKIVAYVAQADPSSETYRTDSLGRYHDPQLLKKVFTENNQLENGIKGDKEALFKHIDSVLEYSVNTWNPGFMDKLYASTNPIGVVSDLILSVLNTNSHVYTVSPVLSVLENYIGRKYARMFYGDSSKCGGLTFSGGLWSNITALQIARSILYPETKQEGNTRKFAVFASRHCHYSVEKAAILLGFGSKSVFKVGLHADGSMDVKDLEKRIEEAKENGYTPLFVNATAGTTVFGLFDDFTGIAAVAKRHSLWFHVDGSWGGNVVFSKKHGKKLAGCELAHSITVNPHKMLGTPTTCSFLLLADSKQFQTANSLNAPYLFHGRENDDENLDLADGTMGCGRRADSFKFHLTWLYYGSRGLERRVDHAFDIVEDFVHKIQRTNGFELVVADPQCLQVCFYYSLPTEEASTEMTRYVSRELHSRGRYLIDFSPDPLGGSKEFFRVVFNSPILTDEIVDDLISSIVSIGNEFRR